MWSACTRDVIRNHLGLADISLEEESMDAGNLREHLHKRSMMNRISLYDFDEGEIDWALDTFPFENSECKSFKDYEVLICEYINKVKNSNPPLVISNQPSLFGSKTRASGRRLPRIGRSGSKIPLSTSLKLRSR